MSDKMKKSDFLTLETLSDEVKEKMWHLCYFICKEQDIKFAKVLVSPPREGDYIAVSSSAKKAGFDSMTFLVESVTWTFIVDDDTNEANVIKRDPAEAMIFIQMSYVGFNDE